MRYVVAVLALLLSLNGWAAGALTQQKCQADGTSNTDPFTISFDSATSTDSGTVIVAAIGFDDPDDVTSVDDGASALTWTEEFEVENSSFETASIWTAEGTSSITDVDFDYTGNITESVVCIYEFSGLDYSSRSSASTTVTNSDTHGSGTVTAETDGIMVGALGGNTDDFGTASSPWTDGETRPTTCTGGATTDCRGVTQYRLVASGDSLEYSITAGASTRDSGVGVIEIGPSGGGGGGGATSRLPLLTSPQRVLQ